ncbi:MAG: YbaB/EbfC family nucleoid-associated protein [Erysipelotrichales bacterium]|nr:YbaB/EbfC family nucleoid-associated protein [Erysipelotrichales bacterium]
MNMQALMQQAQRMQKDMEKKQNELKSTEYTGESQLVKVVLMGDKTLKSVNFKNINSLDKEDIEMLQDMIKIAHDDAIKKINADLKAKMGPYAEQLGGLM